MAQASKIQNSSLPLLIMEDESFIFSATSNCMLYINEGQLRCSLSERLHTTGQLKLLRHSVLLRLYSAED